MKDQAFIDDAKPCPAVRRRRVYYVSGFDPRGVSHYHQLYREEALKHPDAVIEVGRRIRRGEHVNSWSVHADWNGEKVVTDYQFLEWHDLMRQHWEPNIFRLLRLCMPGYVRYVGCGAFGRIRQTFRGPFYSGLYPLIYLIALMLASALCAGLALALLPAGPLAWISAAIGMALSVAGGLRLANRLGVFWLLRTYAFVYFWGIHGMAGLDDRLREFSEHISHDQAVDPVDEVLIVGHSVGALVAISMTALLVRSTYKSQRSGITLLTLGQCVPLLSFIPSAHAFRRDLTTLAEANCIAWVDITARADSLCFAQANLLDVSGIDGTSVDRPSRRLIQPFRMFDRQQYRRIKRNKLRLHFQYLMAAQYATGYDYFRITAGPRHLESGKQPIFKIDQS